MSFDIFNSDAFGLISLTNSINGMPFVPGRIAELSIFEEEGISTTNVMIEEDNGVLSLVENQPRGADPQKNQTSKRKARSLLTTHLPVDDRIMADSIQGVREFGSLDQAKTIENVVNARLASMGKSLDATLEYHRIGAVQGVVYDSNGSTVIHNLFTEFGVTQEDEVDFDLDNATPASGIIRKKCAGVIRKVADNLGAVPFTGVHCFCGDTFFDDLIAHKEVRETYLAQQEAAELRKGYVSGTGLSYGTVTYGGIVFENYRGRVGSINYINADKAHFFPTGADGIFKTFFAPANYIETVNTIGLPKYAKVSPDMRYQKWVDIEAQSNPLSICTRPKVLMKAKRT